MASKQLDKIKAQLLGSYKVHLELNDQLSIDKLGWLKRDDRDFLTITSQLEQAATKAVKLSLDKADMSNPARAIENALNAAGESIIKHIATRFQGGRRDVRMRPLSRGWIKKKGHNRIGIYTGDLFKDLLNATVSITKEK